MEDLEDVVEAKMTCKDVQQEPEARSNMISSLPRLQDQSALNWSRRTHPDSVFDDPHMVGKLI